MRTRLTIITILALCAACLPKAPQDTDTDPGPDPDPDSGSDTGSGSTDGEQPGSSSTGGTPEPTTTAPDDTTGDGFTCPQGHPTLAPLWSTTLPLATEPAIGAHNGLGVLGDGRIVVAGEMDAGGDQGAPGLFWVAPDGAASEFVAGSLVPAWDHDLIGLRVASDDTVVLVGKRSVDGESSTPFVSRFAAGGAELTRVDLQTAHLDHPRDIALLDDQTVVIAGYDWPEPEHEHWLALVDVATGKPAWEVALPGKAIPSERHLAVGPGGEIVVGHGLWPNDGDRETKVWRVDQAGAIVWERGLDKVDPNFGSMRDLVVSPAGQILVVTMTTFPQSRVSVEALALADGVTLWELDVAQKDPDGDPFVRVALLDDDALTLPIVRGPDFASAGHVAHDISVHRVSFAGEHMGAAPLAYDGLDTLTPWFNAARGACGELLLFQQDPTAPSLAAFAP